MSLRLPTIDQIGIRALLERNASECPDREFVTFEDGTSWTFSEALNQAFSAANVLRGMGVQQGQVVAILLGNGADFLRAWWGAAALGATTAMFNPTYQGEFLGNLVRKAEPVLVISESDAHVPVAAAIDVPSMHPFALRSGSAEPPKLERPIEVWDVHGILCTSGTTGGSKAVLQSYHHLHTTGSWATIDAGLSPDDTLLVDLPLFHAALNTFVVGCLATRSRLAVRTRPQLSRYWAVARETGATIAVGVSAMAVYLQGQPTVPEERDHRMRYWIGVPLPSDPTAFAQRFGISGGVLGAYGCTEIGVAVIARPGVAHPPGSCGRARPGFELRIVDENDVEVPAGQPGELVVRTELPWAISHGYLNDGEATAASWRNGWFHTGDALSVDEDGNYYFRDRIKDVIRRRGENISSFEIERIIAGHPAIEEAACIAVSSDLGIEDEIKVLIVRRDGADLDYLQLVEWLAAHVPYFMVPRFFEEVDSFPKTATGRIQKFLLRGEHTDRCWDREPYIAVTRDGVKRRTAVPSGR
ncbi:AMP-binding protein [Mycolicibacterium sphagni]|uniref:ATP-dependent acyl-CoA ligase n=1 Tax=Mycolicibacterium sphagni TaxID=1786 RepID=A0A255D9Z4_9MYCO|nr:AMP-binding protein [Mycolicibacterium sphagni]OYN76228.1 hypothetical protein CG716_23075 [Mycolicibacterium sphagni]